MRMNVPKLASAPRIDGRLDDDAWIAAPSRFLTRIRGAMPMYGSAVRVAWDEQALYVAFNIEDSDVRSDLTQRDARIWEQGDCVEMFLFGPSEQSLRIELEMSPRGAFLDILHLPSGRFDETSKWTWLGAQWAASVQGKVNASRLDRGWTAEWRLPWSGIAEVWQGFEPQPGAQFAAMFMVVNRNRVSDELTAREQSFWPAPEEPRVNQRGEFAQITLVEASPGAAVEGFSEFVHSHRRRSDVYLADFRGLADYREFDSGLPDAELSWLTAKVPATPGPTVQFTFTGQTMGGSPQNEARAELELLLDGKPIVRFKPFQQQNTTWQGEQATLEFVHRLGKWQPSGVFVLTVPSKLVQPGRRATLAVRAVTAEPRTTFMIKAWTDSAQNEAQPASP
jgi:hypothetical protein